jgi:hypothetical protein
MKTHPIPQLIFSALLLLTFNLPTSAQGPTMDGQTIQPWVESLPSFPDATPQRAPDGRWFMPANHLPDPAAAAMPQASGGPDDFGYTWTDTEPLNWINASGGTDTGINNSTDHAGPIDIGFQFKFYENARSQLYVSRSGFLAFSDSDLGNTQSRIPDPSSPNEVIAPYWVPVDTWGPENAVDYVRYLHGGSMPNRWFAVEWNHLRGHCCSGDGTDEYTFETVLHENGNIIFQYAAITTRGSAWCSSSGIEDTTGLDGLEITSLCSQVAANHAVRISRPAPAARAALIPKVQGAFGVAGTFVQFDQSVRNTGEFGTDTFDLTLSSVWPTSVYRADGSTPLTDTDSDGTPDTGPIAQGDSTTIVVKTALPVGAAAGDSNTVQLSATPSNNPAVVKTARYQTAIPAAFAQTYGQSGQVKIGFYRPYQQFTTDRSGSAPVVASAPDGKIIQVWRQSRSNGNGQSVWELYYAVLDRSGNESRPPARLTDLSAATTPAYELSPGVAVAPDGRIGITWRRRLWNSNDGTENNNIYFMQFDSAGATVLPPTNLTNNTNWGTSGAPNVPNFDLPTIAATLDGRFGLAWARGLSDGSSGSTTTWYTVRGADGGQIKAPTQFSGSIRGASPNLTSLADGTLFLVTAQLMDGQLSYGRIDRNGDIVAGPIMRTTPNPMYPDAVQLSNGNIVLAWSNFSSTPHNIVYLVLNSALGVVKGPTSVPNASSRSDDYVSLTLSKGWAVLTWLSSSGAFSGLPSYLYYMLLDGGGNIVTPPITFLTFCAGCSLSVPSNGQGNAPLVEAMQVTGQVLNNQHRPIFLASIVAQPAGPDAVHTDGNGRYVLYLPDTGTADIMVTRVGYGLLPSLHDLPTGSDVSGLDFVLPPETDLVVNGGWETGDLTGWQSEPGAEVTATPVAAHTGLNGLRFGSPVAAASTAMPQIWQIAQTISLPADLTKPTLSWFYRVVSGTPGESLLIQVSNGTDEITRETPLIPGGWMHAWADLSAFSGQTVTLRIGILEADPREVYLDEISIGATQVGVFPVRLPLITRQ